MSLGFKYRLGMVASAEKIELKQNEIRKFQEELEGLSDEERVKVNKSNTALANAKFEKPVYGYDFDNVPEFSKKWLTNNYWGAMTSGDSFSQAGELQSYQGLKNIEFGGKGLAILTKREKSKGRVWNPAFGFLMSDFDYTSAIFSSGNIFRAKSGVIEAMVKAPASPEITSSIALTGERQFPHIDLVRIGQGKFGFGYVVEENGKQVSKYKYLNYLKEDKYHIFRLEWGNGKLTWSVNDQLIVSVPFSQELPELFVNAQSVVNKEVVKTSLPHRFDIAWIRCY